MSIEVFDAEEEKTQREYHLECKVVVKEISYLDEQSKESVQRTEQMVFLVPKHNTQMELFFHAWLPEDIGQHHEIVLEAGHPIYGYFRGAVQRRNADCKDHHIFVMSRGAEEDLKMLKNKTVKVRVLPANDDHKADGMKDFDLIDNKANQILDVSKGKNENAQP